MDLERSLTGLELLRCNSYLLKFFHFVRGPVVMGCYLWSTIKSLDNKSRRKHVSFFTSIIF